MTPLPKPIVVIVPAELIEHWKDPGLCTYGGGLLRFTDPRQFAGILEEWLDPKPKAAHVFLRTAFADLYFWDEGVAYALDVQYGRVSQLTDKIVLFYDHACATSASSNGRFGAVFTNRRSGGLGRRPRTNIMHSVLRLLSAARARRSRCRR